MGGRGASSGVRTTYQPGLNTIGGQQVWVQNASQTTANSTPAQQQTPSQPPVHTPTYQQVQSGNILPPGGVAFSKFEQMNDQQKAKTIDDALRTGVPMFLDQSDLQKFAYFTGMSDKPQLVTEAQLNAMSGTDLWRSVHDGYNPRTDIGYKANDIWDQIVNGDYTNYSDGGGSAHGKGIYFDTVKGSYGSGHGYAIMHAKLNPKSKTITESNLNSMYHSALNSGDPIAKACSKADSYSRENLYALAKGYDVVIDRNWSNYRMVLNRRALIVSSKIH